MNYDEKLSILKEKNNCLLGVQYQKRFQVNNLNKDRNGSQRKQHPYAHTQGVSKKVDNFETALNLAKQLDV